MGGRANPLQDAAAFVGIGQTEFAKQIDGPEGQLAAEAVVAALRDAGITPSEVDGLSSLILETTDVTEGVRQLRGTSTSQVDGATTCLVTSGEGVPTSAVIRRAA